MLALAGVIALAGGASASSQAPVAPTPPEVHRMIRLAGLIFDIDPDLLEAIARVESGGNSQAISPKGAQGLMQLMPGTAQRFGVLDPFNPADNLLGAVRFLDHLRQWQQARRAGSSLVEIIAAYNAGEGAVDKYGGVPPYEETRTYVGKVLMRYMLTRSGVPPAPVVFKASVAAAPAPKAIAPARRDSAKDLRTLLDRLEEIKRQRALAAARGVEMPVEIEAEELK